MPRFLLFSALMLAFTACRPAEITPEERLQTGKWVIHNVNDIQRLHGNNPIKDAYMEFGEDGIIRTKFGPTAETGTWSLNADKTHIYITGDSVHSIGLQYKDSLEFRFDDERTLIINNRGVALEFRR